MAKKKLGSGMTARKIDTSREGIVEAIGGAQGGPVKRLERVAIGTG